MSFVIYMDYYK